MHNTTDNVVDRTFILHISSNHHNDICQIGSTPLLFAIYDGRVDVMNILLKAGANIEAKDNVSKRMSSFRQYYERESLFSNRP